MTDRFDPRPLLSSALSTIRRRSVTGDESQDKAAVWILVGVPVSVGLASGLLGWGLRDANALTAGFALLTGALVGVVPQLASWRQRLQERDRRSEGIFKRKIDEAVYHTMAAILLSAFLTALTVILSNISEEPTAASPLGQVLPLPARLITAVVAAGGAYLLLTVVLVVNLLFDAYQDAHDLSGPKDTDRLWEDEGTETQ